MLQKLRDKTTGWIAFVIVGILVVPFAFFGVTDYFSAPAASWVAKVGDIEISQQQFQQRFEEYRGQMRQMLGERYDAREFERPETRQILLDRMIDEELLRQSAGKSGAVVPATLLRKEIAAMPAFQVDGRFDVERYRLLLAGQNMSPRDFEQRMLRDLEIRMLPQQIEGSAFATAFDIDRYLMLRDQRRDLRYLLIEPATEEEGEVSDADLAAYYEANSQRYLSDETVTIEYVELLGSTLSVTEAADEESLRQRYEEQRNRFVEPEQRLASHILIKTAANADADAQRAAQDRAQALVEQARAEDADFAALAREHSEDPGSRATGGDLGWLEPGITDPAFETALFALQAGAVSDPVKSSDGWHVILLREVRAEKGKSFEDVRAELEREYLETERERRYSELAGEFVDQLYRDPSSLQPAAAKIGVEMKTSAPFGRVGGADPITANPQVIETAFSPSMIGERQVSEPIELDNHHLVALRVVDYTPAEPIALDEIREQVLADYRQNRRAEQAVAEAEALFARWQAGESLDALAAEREVEVSVADDIGRGGVTVDAAIVSRAFELPHPADGQPSRAQVALAGDRHALVEVVAVRPGETKASDTALRNALREQLAQMAAAGEAEAYVEALRQQIPVRVAVERL
ncbi:MAG: SurA N-terminal domain-containing protein [Lysobacteraceae bacterium]